MRLCTRRIKKIAHHRANHVPIMMTIVTMTERRERRERERREKNDFQQIVVQAIVMLAITTTEKSRSSSSGRKDNNSNSSNSSGSGGDVNNINDAINSNTPRMNEQICRNEYNSNGWWVKKIGTNTTATLGDMIKFLFFLLFAISNTHTDTLHRTQHNYTYVGYKQSMWNVSMIQTKE